MPWQATAAASRPTSAPLRWTLATTRSPPVSRSPHTAARRPDRNSISPTPDASRRRTCRSSHSATSSSVTSPNTARWMPAVGFDISRVCQRPCVGCARPGFCPGRGRERPPPQAPWRSLPAESVADGGICGAGGSAQPSPRCRPGVGGESSGLPSARSAGPEPLDRPDGGLPFPFARPAARPGGRDHRAAVGAGAFAALGQAGGAGTRSMGLRRPCVQVATPRSLRWSSMPARVLTATSIGGRGGPFPASPRERWRNNRGRPGAERACRDLTPASGVHNVPEPDPAARGSRSCRTRPGCQRVRRRVGPGPGCQRVRRRVGPGPCCQRVRGRVGARPAGRGSPWWGSVADRGERVVRLSTPPGLGGLAAGTALGEEGAGGEPGGAVAEVGGELAVAEVAVAGDEAGGGRLGQEDGEAELAARPAAGRCASRRGRRGRRGPRPGRRRRRGRRWPASWGWGGCRRSRPTTRRWPPPGPTAAAAGRAGWRSAPGPGGPEVGGFVACSPSSSWCSWCRPAQHRAAR